MAMEYKWLKVSTPSGGVCQVQINRPEALNSLDRALLEELSCCFTHVAADSSLRVLVITGVGKAFVAGADIAAMSSMNAQEATAFGAFGASVFRRLERLPIPVIAMVNGYALGGGCELAVACDIRLASEKAVFGQPEVGLGICPGFGGTQRLPRLIGSGLAAELLFTGRNVRADEALRIGLVNAVHPVEELEGAAHKLAEQIAQKAPLAVQAAKRAMHQGMQCDIETGVAIESTLFGGCFATQDQKEGMGAFLEKRAPAFRGE